MTLQRRTKPRAGSRIAAPRIAHLLEEIRSKDERVRTQARATLITTGARVVPQLVALLEEAEPELRREIVQVLAEVPDPRSAAALAERLEDELEDVRARAAEGLVSIGREGLVPVLEALLKRHESSLLRDGVRQVLHQLAVAELEVLLSPIVLALDGADPETDMREPASRALRRMKA